MLLDERNYKAPPAIAQPSVAGFKAWLEQQPRDQRFNYAWCDRCAVGQYMRSLDSSWDELHDSNFALLDKLNLFAWDASNTANTFCPTFGHVIDEINKAGAA